MTSGIVAEVTALFLMISSLSSIIYCMKYKEVELDDEDQEMQPINPDFPFNNF